MADVLQGYTVVRFKVGDDSEALHYLYCKAHDPTFPQLAPYHGRTLLVVGVPPFCDHAGLRNLMSRFGKTERIFFTPSLSSPPVSCSEGERSCFKEEVTRKGYQMAYVVFTTPKSLKMLGKHASDTTFILNSKHSPVVTGLKKYISEYNENESVDRNALRKEVDEYMAKYDEEEVKRKAAERSEEADDEGWVTVTRQNKRKVVARTERTTNRLKARERKKRENKELLNFYTFQVRESKKNHIKELREKFEEDKRRVALMKSSRKFKPY